MKDYKDHFHIVFFSKVDEWWASIDIIYLTSHETVFLNILLKIEML